MVSGCFSLLHSDTPSHCTLGSVTPQGVGCLFTAVRHHASKAPKNQNNLEELKVSACVCASVCLRECFGSWP